MKNNTKAARDTSPKRKAKKEGPKRGKTSYMIFQEEHRAKISDEVKSKNPDAAPKDLFKLTALAVAEAWKNLSGEEKKPYEEKSAAEKQRLAAENGGSGTEKSPKSSRSSKTSKSAHSDKKRPRTAYVLFSLEQRAVIAEKNVGADFGTLGKLVAEAWKSLPEDEKQTFKKRAAEERSQFDQANAETAEE